MHKTKPDGQNVEALVRTWKMVIPSVADITDRFGNDQYPCDLVRVTTDGDQLAVQGDGNFVLMDDAQGVPFVPTAGAGWTWSTTTLAGTAATATSSLTFALGLTIGQKYLVTITMTRDAGSLTPYCGTTAGTARSTAATFQEMITCAGNGNLLLTGAGYTGIVSAISVYPLSPPLSNRVWEPMSCRKIVAVVQTSTIVTTSPVYAGWLSRPR